MEKYKSRRTPCRRRSSSRCMAGGSARGGSGLYQDTTAAMLMEKVDYALLPLWSGRQTA